jgi:hypothetical protein
VQLGVAAQHEDDGHGRPARIAPGRVVDSEQFESAGLDPRLFVKLACRRDQDPLARLDEPAGQRPGAGERLVASLDQQHAAWRRAGERDDVDRQRRAGRLHARP